MRTGIIARTAAAHEAWKQRTGIAHAINNYTVAPDGRHVAAVISKADAELGDLKIFDVATGKPVLPAVRGIRGELPAAWSRDSRSVQSMQGLAATDPQGMAFGKMQVFERRLAGGADRKLLGWRAGFGAEVGEKDGVFTDPSSSATHTYAGLSSGVSANRRVSAVRTADLARDAAKARWFTIFGGDAGVRGIAQFGRWVYARIFDGASRYRIVRYDVDHPAVAPVEIVGQQRGVIEDGSHPTLMDGYGGYGIPEPANFTAGSIHGCNVAASSSTSSRAAAAPTVATATRPASARGSPTPGRT